ncbi:MAG: phenylalanine--tRNA ligase subunit beta [Verrucomicrobia bacterium]|nr:MAG: phenylalanine--tRNA ligase subunit beta [Verrucomicrobiota bacterium]
MKFSVNWLREFVELPPSIEALAELLTMSGIEIEAIEKRGGNFDHVVIAQINESKPHPNADRLGVCIVDDGSGTKRQIVCGAKNYKVGDKVPLALPGAELIGGLKIRASKLRGVESEGMLCSPKELGIAEDAAGLLILSPEAKIGAPIRDLFPPDTVFDVEITPNRGDLLSHFGLAREIAALTSKKLVGAAVSAAKSDKLPPVMTGATALTISALHECPFYSARRIENVKVGPSPDWLRAKIESVGIRSINNIVDVSNFVMLELGQPTHAFDADKLDGHINVRSAGEGEKFLALDGKTYALTPHNLVVADDQRAVGIAGVMGGEETGVTDSTKDVLLESAYFLPASIRRTARDLNLPSDASYRFERGVDPQMILAASQRATELICEVAGATAARTIAVAGKLPPNPSDVSIRYERADELLGIHIEPATADEILTRFGLVRNDSANRLESHWKIPSYRCDLQREVDLIEEIIRAHGIEKIPSEDRSRFTPLSAADRNYDFEAKLRRDLVALGLSEARTSSLIARSEVARANGAIELRNPLSEDHVALRTTLIPGLLAAVERNIRAGAERIALFEIGNVFAPPNGEQQRKLAIALCGQATSTKNWRVQKRRALDFFDLRGALNALGTFEFRCSKRSGFALSAEIFDGRDRIGHGGQLSSASSLGLMTPVLAAEIDLATIAQATESAERFKEIDRYPAVTRDVAMFVGLEVTHADIVEVIAAANEPLLEKVELFDLFMENDAKELSQARKSLAYSLTYRDKNRTLTNEEVSAAHARIRERLRNDVGAELRE